MTVRLRRSFCMHRDVKAENIVLEGGKAGGRVYLVDFGGVQAAAAGDALQTGSTIIGTYGYMAPEQFRGQATPASDLYGLGGTLLFALSGGSASPESHHWRCSLRPLQAHVKMPLLIPNVLLSVASSGQIPPYLPPSLPHTSVSSSGQIPSLPHSSISSPGGRPPLPETCMTWMAPHCLLFQVCNDGPTQTSTACSRLMC